MVRWCGRLFTTSPIHDPTTYPIPESDSSSSCLPLRRRQDDVGTGLLAEQPGVEDQVEVVDVGAAPAEVAEEELGPTFVPMPHQVGRLPRA